MIVKVFDQFSTHEFNEFLSRQKLELDIYYRPEFLKIEAENLKAFFEIFTVASDQGVFIYPYIKLPLTGKFEGHFDLTSPYGYAGPFSSSPEFFDAGERAFLHYIRSQKAVTEFVRYHFIYNESQFFSHEINNELNRTVIVFNLETPWDVIWKDHISMNNRNYTNRFEKDGFQLQLTQDPSELEEFISLYYQTMENADAVESFFFPQEYFYSLLKELGDKVYIAKIVKDGTTYASVLFFVSGGIVEPFLNGRNLKHQKLPSNVPLYINLAKWAQHNGNRVLNMGGGRTHALDDSLFLFKKRLSNQFRNFSIGKRIHDQKVYQALIEDYISTHGQAAFEKIKGRLQFYR